MYYDLPNGERRTIRSSSQLESLHRFLNESMPGTHMGIEGADMAIIDFCFRCEQLLLVAFPTNLFVSVPAASMYSMPTAWQRAHLPTELLLAADGKPS